jgi:hypothetical protein
MCSTQGVQISSVWLFVNTFLGLATSFGDGIVSLLGIAGGETGWAAAGGITHIVASIVLWFGHKHHFKFLEPSPETGERAPQLYRVLLHAQHQMANPGEKGSTTEGKWLARAGTALTIAGVGCKVAYWVTLGGTCIASC